MDISFAGMYGLSFAWSYYILTFKVFKVCKLIFNFDMIIGKVHFYAISSLVANWATYLPAIMVIHV